MNNYYTFSPAFVPGQKVRSDSMNLQLTNIETGFDALPGDTSAITRGTSYLGVESGSGNSYIVTLPDTRTSYQEGDKIAFRATHANTGAASINIDGIGLASLVRADESATQSGDFIAGTYYEAVYDATDTHWQLLSANASVITEADLRVSWAAEWANKAEDSLVSAAAGGDEVDDYSALHWAAKGSASASAAADEVTYAAEWANKAEDSLVSAAAGGDEIDDYSALHWASKAAASAASLNLPTIGGGDALKQLRVNAGETAYELYDILSTSNIWTADQQLEDVSLDIRRDTSAFDSTFLIFKDAGGLPITRWYFMVETGTKNLIIQDNSGDRVQIDTGAAPLRTTATQLLFNSIDVQRAATTTTTGLVERATNAEVVTGTDTTRYVAPLEIATNFYNKLTGNDLKINNAAYFNAVTDDGNTGTAKTIDWSSANKHKCVLTGNCTFTFTAPTGPTNLTLRLDNDATTTRTVVWPATVDWAGGVAPVFDTGANDEHIISFYWDGATYYGAYGLNFF